MGKKILKRLIAVGLTCGSIFVLSPIGANAEWKEQNGDKYYLKADGSKAIGWLKEDGKWYYLDNNGTMQKNITVYGYRLNNDGVLINSNNSIEDFDYSESYKEKNPCWHKVNGNWTYVSKKGVQVSDDWFYDNGYWYHFNKDGIMEKNTAIKDELGNECILNNDGIVINREGPDFEGNYKWKNQNGNIYYIDSLGKKATGWIQDCGKWYYLNNEGVLQKNMTIIQDGQKYVLDSYGAWLKDNSIISNEESDYSEINSTGSEAERISWTYNEKEGNWYASRDGRKLTGLVKDNNGEFYYMNDDGIMQKNMKVTVNGVEYKINSAGVCIKTMN